MRLKYNRAIRGACEALGKVWVGMANMILPWLPRLVLISMAWICGTQVLCAEPARRPNVLFILADDQRPDTIHALGNRLIETPNLDRLVASGMSFTRAVCA